jgi:hypothetical protein
VLSYGPQLLANWELRKEFKRDVLLTLALAHCGLASEMFADAKQVRDKAACCGGGASCGPGRARVPAAAPCPAPHATRPCPSPQAHVAEGCGHMEAALQLLQDAGTPALAPGLARDILQGLEGLKAPRTLDLLKGALPDDAAGVQARQRVVAELSALLSASAKGGLRCAAGPAGVLGCLACVCVALCQGGAPG